MLKAAFDNKVNYIMEPVKIQGGYAIYEVYEKKAEGYQNFDSIKVNIIKPRVNQKKYNILLGSATDLESKINNFDLSSLKDVAPQYSYGVADSFKVCNRMRV